MILAIVVEIVVLVMLLMFTFKQKTGEPFSNKSVRRFIVFGLLTSIILMAFSLIAPLDSHYFFGKMNPLATGFFTALLLAAIPEEIIKYVMFRLAIRKNNEIKVVHDVIIVSVIIAFGFSLLEDIQYSVFEGGGAILRAFVPMHLLFQVLMGYFYGRAKAEKKTVFHVLSLAVPIIAHTLYDMFIISGMACVDGVDLTQFTEADIAKLPYSYLMVPLLVCIISVAVVSIIAIIIAFVRIKSKRESVVMQERVSEYSEA